ncbi:MAG: hydrogenase maturation protease [Opitutaceae bacterium]|jgi:hydrogenase maturation protease
MSEAPVETPSIPALLDEVLVIGYGNTLRQDDGVGPYVAERFEELGLPGVRTLVEAQLSPEHAEVISMAKAVVFVDAAATEARDAELRPLSAAESSEVTAHSLEPATLLALCRDVYGRVPNAWWLTIRAEQLGFGEEFSSQAWTGVAAALGELRSLVRGLGRPL